MKSDKMTYIIYAGLVSLIKKIDGCANNPKSSSKTTIGKHIPCGIWGFEHIKNKHIFYGGKGCMEKFCKSLSEHAQSVIGFEKKETLPLTNKQLKSHEDVQVCHICRKYFLTKLFIDINHRKVRGDCHYTGKYRGAAHSICNLKFSLPNEIFVS